MIERKLSLLKKIKEWNYFKVTQLVIICCLFKKLKHVFAFKIELENNGPVLLFKVIHLAIKSVFLYLCIDQGGIK